jgi:membrane protein YqaA with SNARE-associated domain
MKKSTTRFYNWAIQKASSPKAPFWLAFLFSLELFFFIPLDAVIMFFCLQKRNNIFLYIVIATLASTISGAVGYLLGHFLWDLIGGWVVPHLIAATTFANLSTHLQLYENWAVFFGALFPLPLKAISLAAGVFQLGILPFIACVFTARLLRCAFIGGLMALWGEKVKIFVDRHFHRLFMLIGAKVAIALLFFWILAR